MTLYLILMYIASLALGYVTRFHEATLDLGKALSDFDAGRGYQDAVMPPGILKLSVAVYVLCFLGIVYAFWSFGWLTGVGVSVAFYIAVVINRMLILPKRTSPHYGRIIVESMISRHADYVRDGDKLRASIMAELLEKMNIPVNEFMKQLKK